MSATIQEIEKLLDAKLDAKLEPIYNKLAEISRDLGQIRRDLGYDNLKIIKTPKKEEKEEM